MGASRRMRRHSTRFSDEVRREQEKRNLAIDADQLGDIEFAPGEGTVVLNLDGYVCKRCMKVHEYLTFACIPIEWPPLIVLAGRTHINTPEGLETVHYDLARKPEKGGAVRLG